MTTTTEQTAQSTEAQAPIRRHPFTVEEYLRLGEIGIFGEDDRVELIEGDIIETTPIGSGHAARVDETAMLIIRATGPDIKVSVQNPIQVGPTSVPQPDIAMLPQRPDRYRGSLPSAAEVLFLIEVSESSLAYDRGVKLGLYARAGIPELWIVDPAGDQVEIFTEPANGAYGTRRAAGRGETVSPTRLPGLMLQTGDLLL